MEVVWGLFGIILTIVSFVWEGFKGLRFVLRRLGVLQPKFNLIRLRKGMNLISVPYPLENPAFDAVFRSVAQIETVLT